MTTFTYCFLHQITDIKR